MTLPLFAYGSLQIDSVIRHVIGYVPAREPALLEGYRRYCVRGEDFPGIIEDPGCHVDGCVFFLQGDGDWEALDRYEDCFYLRLPVEVHGNSGQTISCGAYVVPHEHRNVLSEEAWHPKMYKRNH